MIADTLTSTAPRFETVPDASLLDSENPAHAPVIAAAIDLASREAYLAWVRAWKVSYRTISEQIRAIKAHLRTLDGTQPAFWPARERLGKARLRARNLLVLRAAGKRLSAERRRAALAVS